MSYRWKRYEKPRYKEALVVVDRKAHAPIIKSLVRSTNFARTIVIREAREAQRHQGKRPAEAVLYENRKLARKTLLNESVPRYVLNGEEFPEALERS